MRAAPHWPCSHDRRYDGAAAMPDIDRETPALTPDESAARVAQYEAEGYRVVRETLPDGTVVVHRSNVTAGASWAILLLFVGGCYALTRRGKR